MEPITILKPLPPLPRIYLPAHPVQRRQKQYRGLGADAQGLRRDLFALPSD
jgi:hypothetical protein